MNVLRCELVPTPSGNKRRLRRSPSRKPRSIHRTALTNTLTWTEDKPSRARLAWGTVHRPVHSRSPRNFTQSSCDYVGLIAHVGEWHHGGLAPWGSAGSMFMWANEASADCVRTTALRRPVVCGRQPGRLVRGRSRRIGWQLCSPRGSSRPPQQKDISSQSRRRRDCRRCHLQKGAWSEEGCGAT